MLNNKNIFFLYIFLVAFSVIFADILKKFYLSIFKKKQKKNFSFLKYLYLLIGPFLSTFYIFFITKDFQIFKVFLSFSLTGTFLEFLIGFYYDQIVGERLWTYHKLSLKKYTSLLSIPLWGLAGILFYLLAKVFV